MPYAERTIYVHVKNEQEFQPEKTEAVNVFGRRVLISKGAKSEIQRVVSTEVEDSFTTPSVPTPLPAGNEIAAVWASNLAYPRGHAQRFKSQLAESYSKIPLEEYEKKHRRVSGDQILAVLDLPNLATSDVARSDRSQVKSKYSFYEFFVILRVFNQSGRGGTNVPPIFKITLKTYISHRFRVIKV